ncbi:hypothetical protein [Streptomyces sp. NPDC018610]|uniref:hypothetical protein n=1 Tax=Streptomyces sp. NPDC018610 TaxID=3365049 RepID=UPI0037A8F252
MADLYDLNAVRDSFFASQRRSSEAPTVPDEQVYVDRTGRVRLGTGTERDAPLSKVPHGTFAALGKAERLAEERRVARRKLPENAYYEDTPGAEGWVYSITTEFGNTYVMCAGFNGTQYDVRLLEPALEDVPKLDQHGTHLYHSGKICLSSSLGSGVPDLETAYSRSAVWALGVDFVRLGHSFPFNYNQ